MDFETFYPPDRVGMTAWVQEQPEDSSLVQEYLQDKPLSRARITSGDGEVETLRSGGASIEVSVNSPSGATVQFYVYYFPAWQVWVDGEPVAARPEGPHGLLTADVPAGEHRVLLRFTDTPWGRWGMAVSGLSLLVVVVLLLPSLRRR
jgi:hypothetical protein